MIRNPVYSILITLVLLTPFIWSGELYNGLISAKEIWFRGVMTLMIFGFAVEMLFSRRKGSISLNLIDISLLVFYGWFFIRTCFTPHTPLLYNEKFINYTLLVLFFFMVKNVCMGNGTYQVNEATEKNPVIKLIILVLMLTGLIEAILGLMQFYGFTRSFHSGFKITGTFFNPAPYALYLAAIFPIAFSSGMKELKNEGMKEYSFVPSFFNSFIKILGWLTVISILLVLPATINRASWAGAAAGAFLVFNHEYNWIKRSGNFLKTGVRKIIAIAGIVVLITIIAAGLYQFKKGSSTGRLLIWEVTAGKIAEKPLAGYGVGRFETEYNKWQAEYFKTHPEETESAKGMAAGNTKYCFNEYLEMVAEIGIVGVILFLITIARILDELSRKRFKGNQRFLICLRRSAIPSFFHSLIVLLFCGLVSFPFYSLPTLILLFLLMGVISSGLPGQELFKKPLPVNFSSYSIRLVLAFMAMPVLILLIRLTRDQYRDSYAMNKAVKLYGHKIYDEACRTFDGIYPTLKYNGAYLQYYGKSLSMKGDFEKSIETLERARLYASDEMLYSNLGSAYDSIRNYAKAEQAYLYASCMAPNKLYPLYLLANLYEKTREKEKAVQMAERILSRHIKVPSGAADEITAQMKLKIERLNKKNN